ncbi:MAG: VTT domain-containing protein [Chloroflexota bacterium]
MDQVNLWFENARAFVFSRPVLFVLASGFAIAFWQALSEVATYWAARLGGHALVARLSRWLRVDLRHIGRAESLFTRWGVGLVMFGRIFPGVRTLVSVPAGMTRMNFALFFGASLGGAYVWNTLLVAVGYLMGWNVMG